MKKTLLCLLAAFCAAQISLPVTGRAEDSASLPSFLQIPDRPAEAVTGSEFARLTARMSESDRQRAALFELRRGNVPQFVRQLKPITISRRGELKATFWVTPDYLAIGSDADFLRIPLTLPSALIIAEEFGGSLPTPMMVDVIYQQAEVKLSPQPLPAGEQMRSNDYYLRHQHLIQKQLGGRPLGELVAGHKKDVVVSNRLLTHPGRIAIYGWHRPDGRPIQPLSTVHGAGYADYSHGIRLVSSVVMANGKARSIYDAFRDPALTALFSNEGVLARPPTMVSWNR